MILNHMFKAGETIPKNPILLIILTREPAATQPGSYYSHPIAGRQRIRLPGVGAPSHIAVAILYQYIQLPFAWMHSSWGLSSSGRLCLSNCRF